MPKKNDMASDAKAQFLLDAVEDRKAVDPVLIDLRDKTLMTDFFLVCSGTSNVHIRAIAERVQERAEEINLARPRIAGASVGEWVLIDFGDVVIHVMGEEPRDRYKLEQFWTTPQPKGALPPTPESLASADGEEPDEDDSIDDLDDLDFDDEDEDAAFFDDADTEVDPIEEEDDLPSDSGKAK